MTPELQQEREQAKQIDMPLRTANVAKILHPQNGEAGVQDNALNPTPKALAGEKPPKKPRSDKGKPRKQADPPVQAGGKLSKEDANRGMDLVRMRDSVRTRWEVAMDNERNLHHEYEDADAAVLAWFRENTAQ